jgi:putative phage-type endonuclease
MALTDSQKAIRRTGLGGSDIGAALGFCQHRSPLDVYREKVEGASPEENYRMWWGTGLESFILDTLQARPNYFTPEPPPLASLERGFVTLQHPREPWVLATPDGLARLKDGRRVLLECKTASVKRAEGWGDAGSSDVPTKYAAQCLWTLNVLRAQGEDFSEAWVLVVFGNREPQRFVIPWDEGRAAWLVFEGRKFWNENVLARVPPTQTQEAA